MALLDQAVGRVYHPPLPHHILVQIFEFVVSYQHQGFNVGGVVTGWNSNESIKSMALVCRNWEAAANFVLHRSIAVRGSRVAALLLRSLQERPELGHMCSSLMLGMSEEEESAEGDVGQARTSSLLVLLLQRCPHIQHLHLRPLQESVREPLLAAITSLPLVSFVCSPRLFTVEDESTRELFRPQDVIRILRPSLQHLELDIWAASAPHDGFIPPPPPSRDYDIPTLNLRSLRLVSAVPACVALLILRSSPALEYLDIYHEGLIPAVDLDSALQSSAASLRVLEYVANPSLDEFQALDFSPTLDRLLPSFKRLERLTVSGCEVSASALWHLPSTLRHLEIQNLHPLASFTYSERLLNAFREPGNPIPLETFTLRDSRHEWTVDEVSLIEGACMARGISFLFTLDDEVPNDDNE
ncbi:hypothetical protein T439DRAFT_162533 [Meredithblackwellia eburnea MCA 4105]